MTFLIFFLFTFALFAGFLVLSDYEARHGTRFLARERAHFDKDVERVEFILTHVDFTTFLRDEFRRILRHVAHDVAHVSLQVVRLTERFLTRVVRRLRVQQAINSASREQTREFVKTLSDFKDQLAEPPPKIPDIY